MKGPFSYRKSRKQPFGAPAVCFDLRPQRVHVVETALVAQTLNESELYALTIRSRL